MRVEKVRTVKSTISTKETKNHPYLVGAWQPNYDEYNAYDLESEGEIPEDINGVYIRNTENQIHEPIGRYHPFDGDGMIHAIIFNNGTALHNTDNSNTTDAQNNYWGHSNISIRWVGSLKKNPMRKDVTGFRIARPQLNNLDDVGGVHYDLPYGRQKIPNKDHKALMTIWCPLIGFSEKCTLKISPKSKKYSY